MARGWESKSVEQQQAEMGDRNESARQPLSPAQQKLNRKREGLLLSRTRLLRRLETSNRAQHRQILHQALAEIDRQLACFEGDIKLSVTQSEGRF
jgi:hypothetical protein